MKAIIPIVCVFAMVVMAADGIRKERDKLPETNFIKYLGRGDNDTEFYYYKAKIDFQKREYRRRPL